MPIDSYTALLYLHVLLFVYWLGADLGVFTLALALKNPAYSYEQRTLMMRLSLLIDMIPRVCFATIAPVGLHLAMRLGLVLIPTSVMVIIWSLALLWIVGEVIAFRRAGQPIAMKIYIAIGLIFVAAFLAGTIFGAVSLITGAPIAAKWLAAKVLLFGIVFFVSIMMARYYAPLEKVFERMRVDGSTPEIEAEICGYVNKGGFFTVLLFVMLAVMGFLGLAKPF